MRPALAGTLIVAATATVVLPLAVGGGAAQVGAALALVMLTLVAIGFEEVAAIRACIVLDSVFVVFAAGALFGLPGSVTTVLVCLLPVGVLVLGGRSAESLRPVAPWLRVGGADIGMLALGLFTAVVAGAGLTTWATVARPAQSGYLGALQEWPWWVGVVGVIGFALVNPVWEEVVFRGVVLHELGQVWGVRAAIVLQALLFGSAHCSGFPSGWFGMAMAAVWGVVLGIIRVRSGGLGLVYAVHVCANAVIGTLAIVLLG